MGFVRPLIVVGGLLLVTLRGAAAQAGPDGAVARGTVLGTILDASTSQALPGAVVMLEPGPAGAVLPARGAPFWATGRTQVTDAQGAYRFTRLPPGEYRLLVRRLGYRPAVVAVDLRQNSPLRLSVGMTVQPIRLEPTEVTAPRSPFRPAGAGTDRESLGRVDVELYRQREFLESDTRALTQTDLTEAVTLGETDLFRALLRLPGVTTRDDFTAELWTRGAPWSQTRVYYDGMPLFNPLHTVGVFSGVNPDAVGAAFFHPGGRGAALGEGAAAVLNLVSRPARGAEVGGSAELSVVSGRLALDGPLGRRGGWMVAGRRSYVDLLTDVFADSAGRIPYAFQDLASRVDIPLGASSLAVSGLWERDDLRGTVRDLLRDNRGHWGNAVLRASVTTPLGGLVMRHTLGQSRFAANVTRLVLTDTTGTPLDTGLNQVVPVHQPTDNGITETILSGSLESGGAGGSSAGYEVTGMRQRYVGPSPRPYPLVVVLDTLQLRVRRTVVAFWGAHRWETRRFAVDAGVRMELPGSMANVPELAVAPRVSARFATGPTFAVSAAFARTYQYTQTIAPAGPGVGPDLHISDVWGMADDTVPALRSDLATLGADAWLGPGWLGTVTVYGRRVTGVAVPDPEPGAQFQGRPLFVTATNRAAGVEVSARRVMGRVTGSIAYSEGVSQMEASGWTYPASAERRRMLDVTGMVRIAQRWRAGAAFTAASGAPFTRFLLHTVVPTCDSVFCGGGDTLFTTSMLERPNEGRTPAYVTLDLFGEWHQTFGSWTMSAFVQLRNALNRRNAVTYAGSRDGCTQPTGDQRLAREGVCDDFHRGLPLLPLVGVSVAF
jgi:hypothetical protein